MKLFKLIFLLRFRQVSHPCAPCVFSTKIITQSAIIQNSKLIDGDKGFHPKFHINFAPGNRGFLTVAEA